MRSKHLEHTVFSLGVQFSEPLLGRLKPVLLIVILILTFNDMERIDDSSLLTCVLLALVQQVAVNED